MRNGTSQILAKEIQFVEIPVTGAVRYCTIVEEINYTAGAPILLGEPHHDINHISHAMGYNISQLGRRAKIILWLVGQYW